MVRDFGGLFGWFFFGGGAGDSVFFCLGVLAAWGFWFSDVSSSFGLEIMACSGFREQGFFGVLGLG